MTTGLSSGTLLKQRYEILKEIGQGAMGVVYLARDTTDNTRKAVKELNCPALDPRERADFEKLFRREARILKDLKHPNLPKVTEFFEDNQKLYIIMEYVEGKSLNELLEAHNGPLPERRVLDWAITISEILRYLHNQYPPIIFRDLKPANLIESSDGTLKLVDFGIARYYHSQKICDTISLGSPGYAAPEQYRGKVQTDARTDIYGLGVTMHVLLTNRDPSESPFCFPDVSSLNPQVSKKTSKIIAQALMTDRLFRFPSASDMNYALKTAQQSLISGKGSYAPAAMPALISALPKQMLSSAANPASLWNNRIRLITRNPAQFIACYTANIRKAVLIFFFTFLLFLPSALAIMKDCHCFGEGMLGLILLAGFFAFIGFFTS